MGNNKSFTFVSLACGSGGSIQGLIEAGGKPLFVCDPRPKEIVNIKSNFPKITCETVDARWFNNRKQLGADDLLNRMELGLGQLDLLECSVRFSSREISSKALPNLYDFFSIAKRIQPKVILAVGPADLLRDKNFPVLEKQLDSLRYIAPKELDRKRTYFVSYRVLNSADYGVAVAKPYTIILGIRDDIAKIHGIDADNLILNYFPQPTNHSIKSLGDAILNITVKKDEIEFWEQETLRNTKLFKAAKFLPKNPILPLWLPSFGAKQLTKLGYATKEGTKVFRTALDQSVPDFEFYNPKDTAKWGLLHPIQNRILTASEISAAVGLPQTFKLIGNEIEKAKVAADMVPPNLYTAIASSISPLLNARAKPISRNGSSDIRATKIQFAEGLRTPNKEIRAYHCDIDLGDSYARELLGRMPDETHFDYLFDAEEIGQDFVVYGPIDPETGRRPVIGGIKKRIFDGEDHRRMTAAIDKIKGKTEYRGLCSPKPVRQDIIDRFKQSGRELELSTDKRQFRLWIEPTAKKEGHWDRWRTNPIPSATEGWSLDKNTKTPQLSKTFKDDLDLKAEFDFLNKRAEFAYYKIAPVEFKKQRKYLQSRVSSEYRLGRTVFTSLAINKYGDEMPAMNFHIDNGDNNSGLTSISVFNQGRYQGGYFVLPQFRCAFRVGDGDVFVGNSRKVHGVTQLVGKGKRLSVVSYANTALGVEEYAEKAYPPKSPRPNFRVTNYQIGIPSFRRAETLKNKTLALLNRHKIDPKRVTIFVADKQEYGIYKKALEGNPFNKIVIAAPGIIGVRNFMRLYYKEGTPVLFIDDDIKDIEILSNDGAETLLPVENLERDIIQRGFNTMREHNSYIWGIYAARNPSFMSQKISIGLYYIIASFYGNIIRHSDDLIIGTADKEDYERSVQHFIKDGRVVRLCFATANTDYYNEKGGLQETRNKATVKAGAEYMLKKYPRYCSDAGERTKGKMKGMYEIKLNEGD